MNRKKVFFPVILVMLTVGVWAQTDPLPPPRITLDAAIKAAAIGHELDVETAKISGGFGIDISPDERFNSLAGIRAPVSKGTTKATQVKPPLNFSIGARAGAGIHSYTLSGDMEGSINGTYITFEAAAFGALRFAEFSIADILFIARFQVEAIYTTDDANYKISGNSGSFNSSSLLIPILAKLTFTPNNKIILCPLAGVYFTVPLSQMKYTYENAPDKNYKYSAPLGLTVGANIGFDLGIGMLFADVRYFNDFGNTAISDSKGSLEVYRRSHISFALGYDITLKDKTN